MPMIRPSFLSSADRLELEACVCRQREDHGIARRANAILLLDDGESCARIAKFLYLDDDTIRGWHKTFLQDGWDALGWKRASAARRSRSGPMSQLSAV
jgi:transposase